MIEIISFKRKTNQIEIGYRKGDAVVYTDVSADLSDDEAKQKGFEKSWRALEYEQTLEKPSFIVGDNVDEEGKVIEYEKFTPEEPKVVELEVLGVSEYIFPDERVNQTLTFLVVAYDQYKEPFSQDEIDVKVDNRNYTKSVVAKIDGAERVLDVQISAYQKPQSSELKMLKEELESTQEALNFILMSGGM